MAVVNASDQKAIEAAIAGGKPDAAFALLQGYADLRHGDMPPLSKAALAAIAGNPTAVRGLVLGTSSISISVRRFCRKHLPRLGEPAAGPLLALAAESLDPFRPAEGLLGDFGGVVSPIARTILDEKMSFDIKPNHAYSEAGRYGKEVMDDVVFLVGATKYENLAVFAEYLWARVGGLEGETRDWPHADYSPPWTTTTVQEILAKQAQSWGDALVRWTAGRTLLLDESSNDPVVNELASRLRAGGANVQAYLRETLLIQFGRNFHGLGQEHRMALYRNLRAAVGTLSPKLKPYFQRAIEDYREKYPGEADQADRTPAADEVGIPSRSSEASSASAPPAPPEPVREATANPAAATSNEPAIDAGSGPGGERALLTLLRLAFHARLPRLHAVINRTVDEDLRSDHRPESGGSAEDEKLLAAVHQSILEHRARRPGTEDARPRFGEEHTYVPDHVLENARYGAELTRLMIRSIGKGQTLLLASAAATLLPRAGLQEFGEAWDVPREAEGGYFDSDDVLNALAERRIAPIALLHAIFSREDGEFPIALSEGWQRAIAMLYHWSGEAGREAALDLLGRYPYPKEVNEYSNRRDFCDAHLGTVWRAWEQRDAAFLGLAFERFAVPYFWKGSKALLPKREPVFTSSGYAARSDTGEGVALAEVWALASSAGRVPATVRAALQHAELCEAPRTILELAGPGDFDGTIDGVFSLLESSNPAVLATGLGILGRTPAIARERAEEAVSLAARALTSTRSGAAKEAAVTLAALGRMHPSVGERAYEVLADGLALEAAPVLQAILKSLKALPGQLPGEARRRIVELSESDPARFEKLAKPLLAA